MTACFTIIKTDGTITTEVIPEPYDWMGLADRMGKAVGGVGETLYGFTSFEVEGALEPCYAFCNDDIPDHKVVMNERATVMWVKARLRAGIDDPLRDFAKGTIVVISGPIEFLAQL